MKPEQKIPSIHTCLLLKDAGWKAPTERCWFREVDCYHLADARLWGNFNGSIPAPDALEIFAALPKCIEKEAAFLAWDKSGSDKEWLNYEYGDLDSIGPDDDQYFSAPLIEQLALLWIWVKENYPESLP